VKGQNAGITPLSGCDQCGKDACERGVKDTFHPPGAKTAYYRNLAFIITQICFYCKFSTLIYVEKIPELLPCPL